MPHSFGAYLILYIMVDLFNYTRRASSVAHIGALGLGGDNPIRIQSMTTTNTNDTEACVQQAEEIIKAGGELVRFTTQGSREAENMKNINAGIRADGYRTPLVADVHFNPNVADVAALYCEKVRVNPGNYVILPASSSSRNIPTRSMPTNFRRLRFASYLSSTSARSIILPSASV